MAIPLGRSLPSASCDPPERRRGGPPGISGFVREACRSYSVLLPVGFSLPPPLPAARCALTAPFHPCRPPGAAETDWRCTFCGTVPGVAPAGCYPAPYLRGARTFLPPPKAESGHPTVWHKDIWVSAIPLSKAEAKPHSACGRNRARGCRRPSKRRLLLGSGSSSRPAPERWRAPIRIVPQGRASIIAANHPREPEKREDPPCR
jgi:hypothetical protein